MISYELIRDTADNAYRKVVTDIRDETVEALKEALQREETPAAKLSIEVMLDAIMSGKEKGNVVCGDVGLPLYRVKVGSEVKAPQNLTKAIQEGYGNALKEMPFRHPCTRGVNPVTLKPMTPPVIHYGFIPGGDYIEIGAIPKGTGSTPYSAADVLSWELGLVKKFVIDSVWKAGPRACPPYFIGVGIGGELETAAMLATDALMRPINERSSEPEIAKLEEELLGAINELGIGPMGVGGKTSALAVNIEVAYACAAPDRPGFGWIPASALVNCWPCRWVKARLFEDGRVEYL
jgi:tartrate/fumarate subfamily iron-sulfur-dependent hydro-lyase alpha chain